jgi:hypothetical protein
VSSPAYVQGIGVLGPGLCDWPAARAVLRGEAVYLPVPTVLPASLLLPPAERRRAGRVVKLALAVAAEASLRAEADPASLQSVFSSSGGDGHNCHELCVTLAGPERAVSPTRFSNSVHNAAAGYWSIATGARGGANVLCAYDASFGAGLLEALALVHAHGLEVLLVTYDTEYPAPLFAHRPIPDAFGIALVLGPERGPRSLARIEVALAAADDDPAALRALACSDQRLEALRASIPAARGLPLLERIAAGGAGPLLLDYLDVALLAVGVTPCP